MIGFIIAVGQISHAHLCRGQATKLCQRLEKKLAD
jgi:hypothetical protein